jgi:hypothetical protein
MVWRIVSLVDRLNRPPLATGPENPARAKQKTRVHFGTAGDLRAAPPKPQAASAYDDGQHYRDIGGNFHEAGR